MISLGDKANIPVREPGKFQATGIQDHNHSLAPVSGSILSALDHDFQLAGVIPCVAFVLDIQVVHWTHSSMGMCLSHLNRKSLSRLLPFSMELSFYAFWKTTCTAKESLERRCYSCTQMGSIPQVDLWASASIPSVPISPAQPRHADCSANCSWKQLDESCRMCYASAESGVAKRCHRVIKNESTYEVLD